MFSTAEVRWFYAGDLPKEVRQQFGCAELHQDNGKPEKRQDLYLILPDVENLGIKLRGKDEQHKDDADVLEIKRRQNERKYVTFSMGTVGYLEHWDKWTFRGLSDPPLLSMILTAQDKAWIGIEKVRCQQLYAITPDRRVLAVPLHTSVPNGCNVELTQLMLPQQQCWWTLGFEAFSDTNDALEDNAILVANDFFTRTQLGRLEEKVSFGYPQWLTLLTSSS
jgi:hypothetical protein